MNDDETWSLKYEKALRIASKQTKARKYKASTVSLFFFLHEQRRQRQLERVEYDVDRKYNEQKTKNEMKERNSRGGILFLGKGNF